MQSLHVYITYIYFHFTCFDAPSGVWLRAKETEKAPSYAWEGLYVVVVVVVMDTRSWMKL